MTEVEFAQKIQEDLGYLTLRENQPWGNTMLHLLYFLNAKPFVEDHVTCASCEHLHEDPDECTLVEKVREIIEAAEAAGHPEWVS